MMVDMPSLTRAEASARAATVTVTGYAIDLDLTGPGDTFRSRTVLSFSGRPGATHGVQVWSTVAVCGLTALVVAARLYWAADAYSAPVPHYVGHRDRLRNRR